MGDQSVNFQVGQSFGTFNELKAKLESMAVSTREDITGEIHKKFEERTSYLDKKGNIIGFVLAGTNYTYGNSGVIRKKEDIKNKGLIVIGNIAYFIPIIRDGKGGQVEKINIDRKTFAIDKDGDGIIGEDELISKNK